MSPLYVSSLLGLYFLALIIIAYYTSKGATTDSFFTGNRSSPWYLVAFGMIGTSLSGVTFISVPGAVGKIQFAYFQVVLGYIIGYSIIAFYLMPLYYRLNLISIYTYLEQRLGPKSYLTGSFFFILSRTIGAAFRLFLAADVLHLALFQSFHIPFEITVAITLGLIWVYTYKGGIKTIIWTDSFQTIFLIGAVVISVILIGKSMNLGFSDLFATVWQSPHSQIFHWDPKADTFFWKQFISGIFIAIVMTGLDQDMMQKNLTCRHIGDAQKNMVSFVVIMVVVNFLFLCLGALLYLYADSHQIAIPSKSDQLFPLLALQYLGPLVGTFFLLGIIASSYASADSALASLTTTYCIDFLDFKNKVEADRLKLKNRVHIGFSVLLMVVILLFKWLNNEAVVTAVFKAAGFTYGPLLGLFAFGLFTKISVKDRWAPFVCFLSPALSWVLYQNAPQWLDGYHFGFEILLVNGLITFLGLFLIQQPKKML